MPRKPARLGAQATWYCVACAREGKPYVYVNVGTVNCPYGHVSTTELLRKQAKRKAK